MVEGAVASCTPGLALDSIPSGLAGNGCRDALGCESACTAASARRVAPGDLQDDRWHGSGLGRNAIHSARGTLLRGWVAMLGLILLLHFGAFQIVALLWQSVGVNAKAIMSEPLRSTSLGEFWGKRWNLGFRQLSHELIFRPLHRRLGADAAGFLVFAVSRLTAPHTSASARCELLRGERTKTS
jgi:hypothetical protein